jgi:hypothetical protein
VLLEWEIPIDRGVLCVQVLQEQEQATEEEQGVTQRQELEDPIDRGVLCVQVLEEQEQATEEEQGVTQRQEL